MELLLQKLLPRGSARKGRPFLQPLGARAAAKKHHYDYYASVLVPLFTAGQLSRPVVSSGDACGWPVVGGGG